MSDTATRPIDFAAARRSMIDSQLRTSGVNESWVLDRMRAVPREDFVPAALRGVCYMDRSLPLPDGGTLAPPVAHAQLLAEARPRGAETVLVVDNGNGYLPALVEPLVGRMDVVDPAAAAEGEGGGEGEGRYDCILVDGAVERIPAQLSGRLLPDGRLLTGLVRDGIVRLATGRRSGADLAFVTTRDIPLPRLAAFTAPKSWSF